MTEKNDGKEGQGSPVRDVNWMKNIDVGALAKNIIGVALRHAKDDGDGPSTVDVTLPGATVRLVESFSAALGTSDPKISAPADFVTHAVIMVIAMLITRNEAEGGLVTGPEPSGSTHPAEMLKLIREAAGRAGVSMDEGCDTLEEQNKKCARCDQNADTCPARAFALARFESAGDTATDDDGVIPEAPTDRPGAS